MKVEIQTYKKSLNQSDFTLAQVAMIWDFYVTHSFAKTAAQKRSASDYGISKLPWGNMKSVASIESKNTKILLANSINKTLDKFDLIFEKGIKDKKRLIPIEIDTPKIVCLTPYKIEDEGLPKANIGDAESVLTHIRNAFAHGNTYFFDNGMMLLVDKDKSKITAAILIKQQTLLDWIKIIDKNEKFYHLVDVCAQCRKGE